MKGGSCLVLAVVVAFLGWLVLEGPVASRDTPRSNTVRRMDAIRAAIEHGKGSGKPLRLENDGHLLSFLHGDQDTNNRNSVIFFAPKNPPPDSSDRILDDWGKPIVVTQVSEHPICLMSAGIEGQFGTPDDLSVDVVY